MSELRLRPDAGLVTLADGRVRLGGSPLRVLRLSAPAARLAEAWFGGEPVSDTPAHRALAGRLVAAGIAHPRYTGGGPAPAEVTVVVPVRDHAGPLAALLPAIGVVGEVLVVDDGSAVPLADAAARHDTPRGPAAARNTGWRRAHTGVVAFLDADVRPEPGWLAPLLNAFADPDVVAVAPRVRSVPGASALRRYEQANSSLDLGPVPAAVRPGGRVSYLPSAALLVRRSALLEHGGFDEDLRFGEDVDLVWRLVARGGSVRYEPESQVRHAPRANWGGWLRQRFEYGTSAAPLALRHGSAVAPVRVSKWSALAWASLALGRPLTGLALAAATAALLPRKLARAGVPTGDALKLAARGHLGAGRLLADAVTRSWWPLALPVLLSTRRGRWLVAAALGRHLLDWRTRRPALDPLRWLLARTGDDLAYGAGVCWGALREHSAGALLPDLSDWPGRRGLVDPP